MRYTKYAGEQLGEVKRMNLSSDTRPSTTGGGTKTNDETPNHEIKETENQNIKIEEKL